MKEVDLFGKHYMFDNESRNINKEIKVQQILGNKLLHQKNVKSQIQITKNDVYIFVKIYYFFTHHSR
jgi:hypothetical protein